MNMKLCQLILAAVTVGSLTATLHAQDAGLEQWTNDRSRNPKKGGWVSTSAGVSELVYLAPTAKILGSASVQGAVRIYGNAVVSGEAFVKYADSGVTSENLNIYGNALVTGDATVNGAARIYGSAQISENASILGEPAIYENAVIQGHATVKDQATVCGHAIVSGDALVGGTAIIRGYARLSAGTYTNGVVEPPEPAEEIAARLEKEKAESDALTARAEREQKEAQAATEKDRKLRDLFARANKTFPSFQCYHNNDQWSVQEISSLLGYDRVEREPVFTINQKLHYWGDHSEKHRPDSLCEAYNNDTNLDGKPTRDHDYKCNSKWVESCEISLSNIKSISIEPHYHCIGVRIDLVSKVGNQLRHAYTNLEEQGCWIVESSDEFAVFGGKDENEYGYEAVENFGKFLKSIVEEYQGIVGKPAEKILR